VDKVLQNFQQMRGFMQQMTRGGGMPKAPKPAKKRKGFGEL
jgi:signal recognition particle subunit SRP54